MITLKESILADIEESVLADMEDTIARGENDAILSMLFSKNLEQRRKAFNELCSMVESYHPKQHKTTAKMKSSDSYFVQFTHPLKVENGEATNEVLDWISDVTICKQNESLYKIITMGAYNYTWGRKISAYEVSWRHTLPNFNPKASNTKLYEVPEELNELFERIQMEAYNHR